MRSRSVCGTDAACGLVGCPRSDGPVPVPLLRGQLGGVVRQAPMARPCDAKHDVRVAGVKGGRAPNG